MKNKLMMLVAVAIGFCSVNIMAANSNNTISGSTATVAASSGTTEFSAGQQKAIEKIIHDYLVQHPEVLVEAAQALQAKQSQKMQSQALKAVAQNTKQLFQDPNAPVAGANDPKVVLVEFFDYQCSHCKAMEPIISDLLKSDSNLKIVYKQLPIFGDSSEYAAKAALASVKQNKFAEFHDALFKADKALNKDSVMQIAQSVGLDTKQLEKDMNDPAIEQQIKDNFELAQALRLVGTPSLVLTNKRLTEFDFIPGATSKDDLQKRIDKLAQDKATQTGSSSNAS